jgi:hypothetical protein
MMMLAAVPRAARAQQIDSLLRSSLLERAALDQQQMCLQAEDMKDSSRVMTLKATMQRNGRWLDSVVAVRRWPTQRIVGTDGVEAAWLIAQHADALPDVQRRALAAIRVAIASGEGRARDMAYLEDRVRKAEGKPQVYGTQIDYSTGSAATPLVEDPAHLDERRKSVGLPPMAEYLTQIRELNARLNSMPRTPVPPGANGLKKNCFGN